MTYWLTFNLFQKNRIFRKKTGKKPEKNRFFSGSWKKPVFLKHYCGISLKLQISLADLSSGQSTFQGLSSTLSRAFLLQAFDIKVRSSSRSVNCLWLCSTLAVLSTSVCFKLVKIVISEACKTKALDNVDQSPRKKSFAESLNQQGKFAPFKLIPQPFIKATGNILTLEIIKGIAWEKPFHRTQDWTRDAPQWVDRLSNNAQALIHMLWILLIDGPQRFGGRSVSRVRPSVMLLGIGQGLRD